MFKTIPKSKLMLIVPVLIVSYLDTQNPAGSFSQKSHRSHKEKSIQSCLCVCISDHCSACSNNWTDMFVIFCLELFSTQSTSFSQERAWNAEGIKILAWDGPKTRDPLLPWMLTGVTNNHVKKPLSCSLCCGLSYQLEVFTKCWSRTYWSHIYTKCIIFLIIKRKKVLKFNLEKDSKVFFG